MRTFLVAAASCGAFVGAGSTSVDAAQVPLDANGTPCVSGKLDGALQCIPNTVANGSDDHPYREAAASDARLTGRIGKGFQVLSRRLVYAAVPGSVVVFDVVSNLITREPAWRFVKRITFEDQPAPLYAELISAIMASPATNLLYISTRGHLLAIDLLTEKVVWKNAYEPGTCCERGAVTPDGKTLVVGSDLKNFHYVIDAATGAVKGRIPTPKSMFNHNMNLCPDGKLDFAASNGLTMTIADVATLQPVKTITFSDHIRVFVINHNCTRIYANLNNLMGFEIADVNSGKVVKRVEAPAQMWKAKWADPNRQFFGHGAPQHGIAMLPDESEIWITDAINDQVLVFENTGQWPTIDLTKSFKSNGQPNGWITFGLDGKYAYMASGDVADTTTHKVVGQLKDEFGRYMDSEKMLEMTFDEKGQLMRTVNQFSQGDPKAYAARIAGESDRDAGKAKP